MTINVLPASATPDDTNWAVFACDGNTTLLIGNTTLLIGTSKHSHDCDSAAERLAAGELRPGEIFADPNPEAARIMAEFALMDGKSVVNHFPEDRQRIMQIFAEIKARKKKGK